jgi:hypothetical protein
VVRGIMVREIVVRGIMVREIVVRGIMVRGTVPIPVVNKPIHSLGMLSHSTQILVQIVSMPQSQIQLATPKLSESLLIPQMREEPVGS